MLSSISPKVSSGFVDLHKNEVLLTSSPISIPDGGVIVTLN